MKLLSWVRPSFDRRTRRGALSLAALIIATCDAAHAATPYRLTTPAGSTDWQTIIPGTKIIDDQLVYLDRPTPTSPIEMYVRAIDASDAPKKFAVPLPAMWNVDGYLTTGDPNRLLVTTRRGSQRNYYWADLDNLATVTPANLLFPSGTNTFEALSPGGQYGIVKPLHSNVDQFGLASVSLVENLPPVTHFVPTANNHVLQTYRPSHDGERIIYWTQQSVAPTNQIFSRRLDGTTPPVQLAAPPDFTGNYQISADSSWVVYSTSAGVFSADITGAGDPIPLSSALPVGGTFGSYISIHDRVLFRSEATPGVMELFSVPIDGSSPAVKLNGDMIADGDVVGAFDFTPDFQHALFRADAEVDGRVDLFARRIDGTGPLIELGDPSQHGSVFDTLPNSNGQLLYLATTPAGDAYELFSTDLANPSNVERLYAQVEKSTVHWSDYRLSDDGKWFFYGADFDGGHYQSVMAVATDGSTGTFEVVSVPFIADPSGETVTSLSVGAIHGDVPRMVSSGSASSKSAIYSVALAPPAVPGDFNRDGVVDAADYTVWRDGLGGIYTPADHALWKANFGQTAGSASAAALPSPAVPEPSSLGLLLVSSLALAWRRAHLPRRR